MSSAAPRYYTTVAPGGLNPESIEKSIRKTHREAFPTGGGGEFDMLNRLDHAGYACVKYFGEGYQTVINAATKASTGASVCTVIYHFVILGDVSQEINQWWNGIWKGGSMYILSGLVVGTYPRLRKQAICPYLIAHPATSSVGEITICTASCYFMLDPA